MPADRRCTPNIPAVAPAPAAAAAPAAATHRGRLAGPAGGAPADRRRPLSSARPTGFDFGSLDSRCAPTTGAASGAHRAGFAPHRALGTPLPIAAPAAIANPVRAAAIGVHATPVARVAALAARGGTLVFAPVAGPRAAVEPAAGAHAPAEPTTDASPERTALDLAAIDPAATIELTTLDLAAIDPAATIELTHETIAALITEAAADPAPCTPPAAALTAPGPTATAAALTASGPTATANELAPGPTATAADPAAAGWRDRPYPALQPPWAPRSPAFWHHRRPPRIDLVVFLLIGTLLCGLLAPFCWSVASTELGAIRHGAVEDRHRGLLTLAQIWGALATCVLIAVCCYALSTVAGTSAHAA